ALSLSASEASTSLARMTLPRYRPGTARERFRDKRFAPIRGHWRMAHDRLRPGPALAPIAALHRGPHGATARLLLRDSVGREQQSRAGPNSPSDGSGFVIAALGRYVARGVELGLRA